MQAHGLNTVQLPGPEILDCTRDGDLTCDWREPSLVAEAIKETSLHSREHVMDLTAVLRETPVRGGPRECTPGFARALGTLAEGLETWRDETEVRVLVLLNGAGARRNGGVLRCIETVREKAPGLRVAVSLTAEEGHRVSADAALISAADICLVRPTPASWEAVYLVRDEGLAEYWQRDVGMQRLCFGLLPWRDRAAGVWQWAYSRPQSFPHVPFLADLAEDAVAACPGGVCPTPKYEFVREGIDDLRYLRALETALR
jgi:hypothetical protein